MATPFSVILAFFGKTAAAKDLVRDYLKGYVHPRFLEGTDFSKAMDSAYTYAVNRVAREAKVEDVDIDRERFEDVMALSLTGINWSDLDKPVKELRKLFRTEGAHSKKGQGNELAGALVEFLRKNMKVSVDDADELVDPVGDPGEHLLDQSALRKARGFVFEWLKKKFTTHAGHWVEYIMAQKRQEMPTKRIPREEASGRELEFSEDIFGRGPELKSDEQLAQEAVREQGIEKKVYLKTLKFISGMQYPELFKSILHYRIMGLGGGKTLGEIGENFGLKPNRVAEKEEYLIRKLKELFGAQVDTRKEVKEEIKEEGEPSKESPKETLAEGLDLLKNETNRKNFLNYFFEHKRTKPDSQGGKTIKLLAEGKTVDQIAEELGAKKQIITNEKNRSFVPMLREWVEEEMRTACDRIKTALLAMNGAPLWYIRQAVTKRVPFKPSGEEKAETPTESTSAHRKIVEQRLPRTLITVHFSSPMDWLDVQEELKKKDIPIGSEKGRELIDDVKDKFKFLKYEAVFDERWTFGRKDQTVNYTYEQDLSPDGKFVGQPKSSMRVNGKRVTDDDAVKQILDEFVEDVKKKHGLWAGGKKFRRGVMPAQFQYINEAKNEDYTPTQVTRLYPPAISKDDPVHKEVREEKKQLEFRKVLGPSESREWTRLERQTKSTIDRINKLITEEKKKPKSKQDPEKLKKYDEWIEKLQSGLEEQKTKELKEELQESQQFLESEEEYWEWRDLEDEASELAERLNTLMEREKDRDDPDKDKITKMDKLVTDIDKGISQKNKESLKKTIEEAKKIIAGEKQKTAALEKYAQGIGEPESDEAKDFVELAQKYEKLYKELGGGNLDLPKLTSWKRPGDVVSIAGTLSGLLEEVLKRKIADIKKKIGPTKGLPRDEAKEARAEVEREIAKAEKEISKDRGRLQKLYRSYVTDLKNRIHRMVEEAKSVQQRIKELQDKKRSPGGESITKIMDDIKKEQAKYKTYESITNRIRNFDWTEDAKKIGEVVEKGEKYLEKVPDIREKKEPSLNVVEHRKYESLKGFVQNLMDGFKGIANQLDKAPLKPIAPEETTAAYEATAKQFTKDAEDIREQIRDLTKEKDLSPEQRKEVERLEKSYKSIHEEAKKKVNLAKDLKVIQAVYPARVAWRALSYFSELYNLLSSYLWFRETQLARKAYEIIAQDADEGPSRLEVTKDDAAEAIRRLSRYDVMNAPAIKKDVQTAKNLLNKMFNELDVSRHASVEMEYLTIEEHRQRYGAAPNPEKEKQKAETREKEDKEESKKKHRELRKTQLPGPMLERANQIIKRLKGENLIKEIGDFSQEAKNDLEDLKEALAEYQEDRMGMDEIKKKAKEWGISVSQMQSILKQMEDDFIEEAFNTYENEWMDRIDTERENAEKQKAEQSKRGPRPERKGPFMLLPAEKYEEIPRLLQRAGIEFTDATDDEPEKVGPTKKTPRSVSHAIEKAWKRFFTPEQVKKAIQGEKLGGKFRDKIRLFYESELDKWGFGGADKVKGKTRPKAVKPPPPAITREQMQKFLKEWIKNKPAGQIVTDWLNLMLTKIKRAQKEGQVYDEQALIHAVVNHLKSLKTLIVSLDVGPSGAYKSRVESPTRMRAPYTAGDRVAVSPGGAPDISFDSKEEAIALWDKIADIYKRINRYIKPDDIITVPNKPARANLKKFYGDMPRGLVDWYEDVEVEKKAGEWDKIKEELNIRPNELSYNVVKRFAASSGRERPLTLEEEFDLIRQ